MLLRRGMREGDIPFSPIRSLVVPPINSAFRPASLSLTPLYISPMHFRHLFGRLRHMTCLLGCQVTQHIHLKCIGIPCRHTAVYRARNARIFAVGLSLMISNRDWSAMADYVKSAPS